MASTVPNVTLNNGCTIPIFGLGTWKSKPGEVVQAIKDAVDGGYRHFDCAMIYGNEGEVGEALQSKIQEGAINRKDLFITSKVWNTFHSKGEVPTALKTTLQNLKLSYLDLYLIHWPVGYKEGTGKLLPVDDDGKFLFSDVDYTDTWLGMEECLKMGLVKSIGVSNFNKNQIERVLEAGSVVPVINQVECHPCLAQKKLLEFCKSKGIALTAYSPLGSPDRPWLNDGKPALLSDPRLVAMADKYNKTPAQVLCRFQIQRGIICIPKSVTKSRIEANMQIWDFELSADDMDELLSYDCKLRYCAPEQFRQHMHYPFNEEF